MTHSRVAVVTGASGALGSVIASKLSEAGYQVAGIYNHRRPDLPGIHTEQADVTSEADIQAAISHVSERFGRIDALVNVAGGFAGGTSVADTDEAVWDHMMNLNLKSAFLCIKAVLPTMLAANFGRIVNISSRSAVEPSANYSAYSVSKMGVLTLTTTLAAEMKGHDVTVNAVLPSIIDTAANRDAMPKADFSKWVKPEALAAVIADILSERWGIVSGAVIPVYGKA